MSEAKIDEFPCIFPASREFRVSREGEPGLPGAPLWLAGIFLGLLSYKPQFGILFPIVLLVSRNWRVLLSAAATTLICVLIATVAFGYQVWPTFIAALGERASSLSQDPTSNFPLISFLGMLQFAASSALAPALFPLQSPAADRA